MELWIVLMLILFICGIFVGVVVEYKSIDKMYSIEKENEMDIKAKVQKMENNDIAFELANMIGIHHFNNYEKELLGEAGMRLLRLDLITDRVETLIETMEEIDKRKEKK